MTTRLKKIVDELHRLNDEEQNSIAELLREELSWKKALEKPDKAIFRFAKEALKEHREGKTKNSDW